MKKIASNLRAGIVIANGFKDNEYLMLKKELSKAGFNIVIISPENDFVKSENIFLSDLFPGNVNGILLKTDAPVADAKASDYDLLVVPGGAFSAYKIVSNDDCIRFLKEYIYQGKVLGAVSDGSRIFKETDEAHGKYITAPRKYTPLLSETNVKLQQGMVVSDNGLVTCKSVGEIHAFIEEMLHFLLIKKVYTDYLDHLKKQESS